MQYHSIIPAKKSRGGYLAIEATKTEKKTNIFKNLRKIASLIYKQKFVTLKCRRPFYCNQKICSNLTTNSRGVFMDPEAKK